MTPNDIEILIHCYSCAAPHPRKDAPAVEESFKRFVEDGLIIQDFEYSKDGDIYRTTDRGAAHVINLCSTPLPEQRWVNQNGEIIK